MAYVCCDVPARDSCATDHPNGVVRVDGHVWDLTRPLPDDCKLEFFSFDEPEGKEVRGRRSCSVCLSQPFDRSPSSLIP